MACALLMLTSAAAAQPPATPVEVAPPGETGRRITDDGLFANYYPAKQKAPAVLLLPGSVGGLTIITSEVAKALQAEGYSVLYLSYFRAPGQNPRAELLPLEYFSTALAWLKRQPEVDPARLGIIGISKGAEAALLVATRHPELKAVIGGLASSVVWPGVVWETTTDKIGSSWTENGRPLPHMTHAQYRPATDGRLVDHYTRSLKAYAQHPDAIIPVEKIAGRMLLVCGELDDVSPSCPMSQQIQDRLRAHGRPEATLLRYKEAGHRAFGPPLPPDHPRILKGDPQAKVLNGVLADSWKNTLAFLKATLAN